MDKPLVITLRFFPGVTDKQVGDALRDFASRIVDTVALREGMPYWLQTPAAGNVGTAKVEGKR